MSHVHRHASTRVMRQRAGPSVAPAIPTIALILLLVIRSVNDHLDTSEICLQLSGLHPPCNCRNSAGSTTSQSVPHYTTHRLSAVPENPKNRDGSSGTPSAVPCGLALGGGRRQHRLGWAEAFIQARAHRFGAKTQTCTQNFRRGQHKSLSHHTMAQKTQEKGVLRSAIPRFQGPGMTQARAGWLQSTANGVRPVGCNYPKMQSPTSFPIEGGPATRWPGAQNRGGQNGKKPAEPSHWLICCHARRRSRE